MTDTVYFIANSELADKLAIVTYITYSVQFLTVSSPQHIKLQTKLMIPKQKIHNYTTSNIPLTSAFYEL